MRWRQSLGQPVGLALLALSLVLAGLLAGLPGLAERSDRALGMVLLGVVAYGVSAGVAALWPSVSPELRRLRAARREIGRLLADGRQSLSPELRAEWDRLASDALLRLDEEIVPALAELLARRGDLARHLASYEGGRQTPPDVALMERLRGIHARQHAAVAGCVQRTVNAEATLMGLLQETGEGGATERLGPWAASLAAVHTELARALEGRGFTTEDAPRAEPRTVVERAPSPAAAQSVEGAARSAAPSLEGPVKEALQHLNKPATLARCRLVALLPRTLEAVRKGWGEDQRNDPTPLGQAHALREALVAAIERLKAGDEEVTEQNLPHLILHQEYVLGTSTKRIMVRHSIAEATLHRRRQEGIRALAVELSTREKLLSRRDDPVARDYLG